MEAKATSTLKGKLLQRECPICGHWQRIAPGRLGEPVTCERCDYWIEAAVRSGESSRA